MAGETPGAQRYSDQRRRLTHLDERNTDKTYRGEVSALGTVPGSVPPRPAPPRRRLAHLDERNTDKTYRALAAPPTAQQLRRVQAGGAAGWQAAPRPSVARAGGTVQILADDDVRPAIEAVVAILNSGAAEVVVEVADVKGLLARARARLETRVAQEVITEDQARDVRFGKASPGAAARMPTRAPAIADPAPEPEGPPPVRPLAEAEPAAAPDAGDPAAFLDGGEVAVPADPLFATEDDGDDEIPPPAGAGEPEAASGEPRQRGRRRGRGT